MPLTTSLVAVSNGAMGPSWLTSSIIQYTRLFCHHWPRRQTTTRIAIPSTSRAAKFASRCSPYDHMRLAITVSTYFCGHFKTQTASISRYQFSPSGWRKGSLLQWPLISATVNHHHVCLIKIWDSIQDHPSESISCSSLC